MWKYTALALLALAMLSGCGGGTSETPKGVAPRNPSPSVGPVPIASYTTTGEQSGSSSLSHPEFTISTFVTLTSTATAHQRIFEQGGANNGGGMDIETNAAGDSISCLIWNSDGTFYQGATALIQLNTRTHVACSFNGNELTLYLDGAQVGLAIGLTYIDPTTNIFIGQAAAVASGNRDFLGTIETVDLYDEALTDAEIAALAN